MHVVVVGCGRVGSGLASAFSDLGHTVAVVDRRSDAFGRLAPGFAGRTVVGVGFDRDVLRQAGIEQAGAVAAVTSGDNSNIVVARVAREAFGVERVVARIYDQRRAAIYERLGVPSVATSGWTIERVLRRVLPEEVGVAWIDPSAQVCLVERALPDLWAGSSLAALEVPGSVRLVALTRRGAACLPTPELVCQQGDVAWFALAGEAVESLDDRLAGGPATGDH